MRTNLLIIFIILLPLFSFAQSEIDSIVLVLKDKITESSKEDTTQVESYNRLSYYTRKGNPDESLEYAKNAETLANKINDGIGLHKAYENIGFIHMNKGEFEEAEKLFQTVYDYGKKNNHVQFIYKSLDNLGSIHYYKGNLKEALAKFEEALEIKDGIAPPRDMGDSYTMVGLLNHYTGDNEKAESLLLKSKAIFEVHSNPSSVKLVEINLAEVYVAQGKWEEAEAIQVAAISFFEKANDKLNLALMYGNHGLLKKETGEYDIALENFSKAREIGEEMENPGEITWNLTQIGNLNLEMGDLEQAKSNAKKVIEISKEIGDIGGESDAYMLLGEAHYQLNEFEDALSIKQSALSLKKESGQVETEAGLYNSIGKTYLSLKKNDLALVSIQKGITLSKEIGSVVAEAAGYLQMANYFKAESKLDSAMLYGEKALAIYSSADMTENMKDANEMLYNVAKEKGDSESALLHHEQLFAISNQIYSDNAQKVISEERVKQNVKDAEEAQEKAELKSELLSSRNTLFVTIAAALLGLLILGIYFYRKLQKSRKEIASQNLQLQELNATKDKFFGIIAHDIRSPIVALDGVGDLMEYYLKKDNKDKLKRLAGRVDSTAKQLGGLLDNLLNWALLQQGVIPYHPKALSVDEVTKNTLAMFQNNAEAKGVKLETNIDTNLKVNADESALNTILRNLVSNAIKFTPSGGIVSISTTSKNDKIFININDTGTGISAEKLKTLFTLEKKSEKGTAGEKGTGLGLTLVKELAELNKGILNVASKLNEGSQFSVGLPAIS